jgi:hypothetical protein
MDLKMINGWIDQNLYIILSVNLLFLIVLAIGWLRVAHKLKKYRYLFKGSENKDLEAVLLSTSEKVQRFNQQLTLLEDKVTSNSLKEKSHMQKWSLLRFKAFQNTGGDQSFALAILDGAGDGFVMSSIFGREESRVYCKPVQGGQSSYALSDEEKEAIEKALGSPYKNE